MAHKGQLTLASWTIQAATGDNPYLVPFAGVVTRLDQPSDGAPGGSGGRRVIIKSEAAQKRHHLLVGTPVNVSFGFKSHDFDGITGMITKSWLDLATQEWFVEGHLWGVNRPEVVGRIQSEKDQLGMSIELMDITYANLFAPVLEAIDFIPTGAAILYANSAAFKSTRLAAALEQELGMDEKMFNALLAQLEKMSVGPAVFQAVEGITKALTAQGTALEAIGNRLIAMGNPAPAPAPAPAPVTPAPVAAATPAPAAAPAAEVDPVQNAIAAAVTSRLAAGDIAGAMGVLTLLNAGTAPEAPADPAVPTNTTPTEQPVAFNWAQNLATLGKNQIAQGGGPAVAAAAVAPAPPVRKSLSPDLTLVITQFAAGAQPDANGAFPMHTLNAAFAEAKKAGWDDRRVIRCKDEAIASGLYGRVTN